MSDEATAGEYAFFFKPDTLFIGIRILMLHRRIFKKEFSDDTLRDFIIGKYIEDYFQ